MRWGKVIAAAAAVGCGVWAGAVLTSVASGLPEAGRPGSADDPLVTKSYVDEQIQRALRGEAAGEAGGASGAKTSELEARVAQLEKELAAAAAQYTVVQLKAGHMLLGEAGTEFIVRTGRAYVHSNSENGIPDLTDGVDLPADAPVPNNHLLQVPREGRGIKVLPDYPNDVYVTIRGNFTEIDSEGNEVHQ